MGDIVNFGGITTIDIPSDRILEEAIGNLDSVVVVGFDKEGELYFESSTADGGNVLWLMALAKKALLEVGEE